ncbi:hypothetical protein [Scytonema sp. NUACC26]|uniref:hypothetical protein n=1 Tax=Scytonema sp. NUACC26 TaxID=3140176 RepID=UPI0034DBD4BC
MINKKQIENLLSNILVAIQNQGSNSGAIDTSALAKDNTSIAIRDRLPTLINGKIPVDASFPNGIATDATLGQVRDRFPATLGQKTTAQSLSVTFPSDQSGFLINTAIATETGIIDLPAAAGTYDIVVPSSGNGLRVSTIALYCANPIDFNFNSSTAANSHTAISPIYNLEIYSQNFVQPKCLVTDRKLTITKAAGATIKGEIVYWQSGAALAGGTQLPPDVASQTTLLQIKDLIKPTIKKSLINISTAGDNIIITPAAGKSINISGLYFTCASSVAIVLKDGSTAFTGVMPLTDHANDYSYPLILNTGNSFVINLASAVSVQGYIIWWEV